MKHPVRSYILGKGDLRGICTFLQAYGRQGYAGRYGFNLVQIKRGLAWHYMKYRRETPANQQSFAATEIEAREANLGLWRDADQLPPGNLSLSGEGLGAAQSHPFKFRA